MRNRVGDQSPAARSTSPADKEEGGVNVQRHNRQTEKISLFAAFKQLIFDAFSSVRRAISRAFSNPRQAQAATMHILEQTNNPQPQIGKSSEEIKPKKIEQGKTEFFLTLELKKKLSNNSAVNITDDARFYATYRRDEFENKKKHENYSVTQLERDEIGLICEILGMDEKNLLPVVVKTTLPPNPVLSSNKEEKPAVVEKIENIPLQKSTAHPGEEAFLEFFNYWDGHKEELRQVSKLNEENFVLDCYENMDCIQYAENLVDPNNKNNNNKKNNKNKKNNNFLDILGAANYLLDQNKRYQAKKIAGQRQEKKRAEKNIPNQTVSENVNKNDEININKTLNSVPRFEKSFSDLNLCIPKDMHTTLQKKLNYLPSRILNMDYVKSGLKFLVNYDANIKANIDLASDKISHLDEVCFFIYLLESAYSDKNGNPIKTVGFDKRAFKYEEFENSLDEIYTNRHRILGLINTILVENGLPAKDNTYINNPQTLSVKSGEKSHQHSVQKI